MAAAVGQLAMLRLLMGALGGFTAVALTLASLSAPPEQTTRAIALVQSAQILGQMVGPALGGLMADHWGIRAAFWGASALAVVAGGNMLLMYQVAPVDTQQRRQRRTGVTRMRARDMLGTSGFVPLLGVPSAGARGLARRRARCCGAGWGRAGCGGGSCARRRSGALAEW